MECAAGTTTGVIFDLSCTVSPPTTVERVTCSFDGQEAQECKSVTHIGNNNLSVCGHGGLYTCTSVHAKMEVNVLAKFYSITTLKHSKHTYQSQRLLWTLKHRDVDQM